MARTLFLVWSVAWTLAILGFFYLFSSVTTGNRRDSL